MAPLSPRSVGAALATALLTIAAPRTARAQTAVPTIEPGIPLMIAPVQRVERSPDGSWPGGAASEAGARARADAELDFAVAESRAARAWIGPGRLAALARRNPLLGVDPTRLAVGGLTGLEPEAQLPEPLRSRARALGAVADGRLLLVPFVLGHGRTGAGADATGRARLELALVDVRAGRLVWRGTVYGEPARADAPGSVATLSQNLVRTLTR